MRASLHEATVTCRWVQRSRGQSEASSEVITDVQRGTAECSDHPHSRLASENSTALQSAAMHFDVGPDATQSGADQQQTARQLFLLEQWHRWEAHLQWMQLVIAALTAYVAPDLWQESELSSRETCPRKSAVVE
jgi:hypothetical protein